MRIFCSAFIVLIRMCSYLRCEHILRWGIPYLNTVLLDLLGWAFGSLGLWLSLIIIYICIPCRFCVCIVVVLRILPSSCLATALSWHLHWCFGRSSLLRCIYTAVLWHANRLMGHVHVDNNLIVLGLNTYVLLYIICTEVHIQIVYFS